MKEVIIAIATVVVLVIAGIAGIAGYLAIDMTINVITSTMLPIVSLLGFSTFQVISDTHTLKHFSWPNVDSLSRRFFRNRHTRWRPN